MEKNQICFNHFKLYLKEQKNASRGSKQKLRGWHLVNDSTTRRRRAMHLFIQVGVVERNTVLGNSCVHRFNFPFILNWKKLRQHFYYIFHPSTGRPETTVHSSAATYKQLWFVQNFFSAHQSTQFNAMEN